MEAPFGDDLMDVRFSNSRPISPLRHTKPTTVPNVSLSLPPLLEPDPYSYLYPHLTPG